MDTHPSDPRPAGRMGYSETMSEPRSIVHVASEMAPLVKVGGLADVVGALALEQARRGHRVTVALPAYRELERPDGWRSGSTIEFDVAWGMGREPARAGPPEGPAT